MSRATSAADAHRGQERRILHTPSKHGGASPCGYSPQKDSKVSRTIAPTEPAMGVRRRTAAPTEPTEGEWRRASAPTEPTKGERRRAATTCQHRLASCTAKSSCECKTPPRAAELKIENSSEKSFETPIVGDGEALMCQQRCGGIDLVNAQHYDNTWSTYKWQGSESFLQPPARHDFPWQGSESFLQPPARHDISRQGSESFLQPPAGHDPRLLRQIKSSLSLRQPVSEAIETDHVVSLSFSPAGFRGLVRALSRRDAQAPTRSTVVQCLDRHIKHPLSMPQ